MAITLNPLRAFCALAIVLAGCASPTATLTPPQEISATDGSKQVTSTAAALVCSQPRCPQLTARWSSKRAGVAMLTIGVPYQKSAVTKAEFHFGDNRVVRLVLPSGEQPAPGNYPATTFDAPVSLIDAIAYKAGGWVQVVMADGLVVQETVRNGEVKSQAVDAMRDFLRVVDAATGKPADERGSGGGVFDLLK